MPDRSSEAVDFRFPDPPFAAEGSHKTQGLPLLCPEGDFVGVDLKESGSAFAGVELYGHNLRRNERMSINASRTAEAVGYLQ